MKGFGVFALGFASGAVALYLYLRISADAKLAKENEGKTETETSETDGCKTLKQFVEDAKKEMKDKLEEVPVMVRDLGYKGGDTIDNSGPYVISQEEFEDSDYDKECYTYYTDGIVAKYDDEIIEHPEDHIGPTALDTFDDSIDVIFVRNDDEGIDYEIDRDISAYRDLVGNRRNLYDDDYEL